MLEISFGNHIWAFLYTFETATHWSQYMSLWLKKSPSVKSTVIQGVDSAKYCYWSVQFQQFKCTNKNLCCNRYVFLLLFNFMCLFNTIILYIQCCMHYIPGSYYMLIHIKTWNMTIIKNVTKILYLVI